MDNEFKLLEAFMINAHQCDNDEALEDAVEEGDIAPEDSRIVTLTNDRVDRASSPAMRRVRQVRGLHTLDQLQNGMKWDRGTLKRVMLLNADRFVHVKHVNKSNPTFYALKVLPVVPPRDHSHHHGLDFKNEE